MRFHASSAVPPADAAVLIPVTPVAERTVAEPSGVDRPKSASRPSNCRYGCWPMCAVGRSRGSPGRPSWSGTENRWRVCGRAFSGRTGRQAQRRRDATHIAPYLRDLADARRCQSVGCRRLPRYDGAATRSRLWPPPSRLPARGDRCPKRPECGTKHRERIASKGRKRHKIFNFSKGE
jgi:hypothetical protein